MAWPIVVSLVLTLSIVSNLSFAAFVPVPLEISGTPSLHEEYLRSFHFPRRFDSRKNLESTSGQTNLRSTIMSPPVKESNAITQVQSRDASSFQQILQSLRSFFRRLFQRAEAFWKEHVAQALDSINLRLIRVTDLSSDLPSRLNTIFATYNITDQSPLFVTCVGIKRNFLTKTAGSLSLDDLFQRDDASFPRSTTKLKVAEFDVSTANIQENEDELKEIDDPMMLLFSKLLAILAEQGMQLLKSINVKVIKLTSSQDTVDLPQIFTTYNVTARRPLLLFATGMKATTGPSSTDEVPFDFLLETLGQEGGNDLQFSSVMLHASRFVDEEVFRTEEERRHGTGNSNSQTSRFLKSIGEDEDDPEAGEDTEFDSQLQGMFNAGLNSPFFNDDTDFDTEPDSQQAADSDEGSSQESDGPVAPTNDDASSPQQPGSDGQPEGSATEGQTADGDNQGSVGDAVPADETQPVVPDQDSTPSQTDQAVPQVPVGDMDDIASSPQMAGIDDQAVGLGNEVLPANGDNQGSAVEISPTDETQQGATGQGLIPTEEPVSEVPTAGSDDNVSSPQLGAMDDEPVGAANEVPPTSVDTSDSGIETYPTDEAQQVTTGTGSIPTGQAVPEVPVEGGSDYATSQQGGLDESPNVMGNDVTETNVDNYGSPLETIPTDDPTSPDSVSEASVTTTNSVSEASVTTTESVSEASVTTTTLRQPTSQDLIPTVEPEVVLPVVPLAALDGEANDRDVTKPLTTGDTTMEKPAQESSGRPTQLSTAQEAAPGLAENGQTNSVSEQSDFTKQTEASGQQGSNQEASQDVDASQGTTSIEPTQDVSQESLLNSPNQIASGSPQTTKNNEPSNPIQFEPGVFDQSGFSQEASQATAQESSEGITSSVSGIQPLQGDSLNSPSQQASEVLSQPAESIQAPEIPQSELNTNEKKSSVQDCPQKSTQQFSATQDVQFAPTTATQFGQVNIPNFIQKAQEIAQAPTLKLNKFAQNMVSMFKNVVRL